MQLPHAITLGGAALFVGLALATAAPASAAPTPSPSTSAAPTTASTGSKAATPAPAPSLAVPTRSGTVAPAPIQVPAGNAGLPPTHSAAALPEVAGLLGAGAVLIAGGAVLAVRRRS